MADRALFLDRDGTIITDVGYPRDPALVALLPGVGAALREIRALGWRLVIISNQSGVARRLIQPDEARAVQTRVNELFAAEGVTFDGAYFCFHGPEEGCACRKPRPGMLLDAARDLGLDLGRSVMIGDKPADLEAGRAAGSVGLAFTSWSDLTAWFRANS